MLTSCISDNGCGTLVRTGPSLQREQMTNLVVPVPGTINVPSGTGQLASTMAMPGIWPDENGVETIPTQPDVQWTAQGNQMVQGSQSTQGGQGPTGPIHTGAPTPTANQSLRSIPGIPDPPPPADPILPENPQFQVPANPLLPPGYQEIIDYENLQYMNGFLRTQIGKYLRVEQLVTTTQIEDRFGYLVGVGLNYILLQQPGTGNISAVDYYSIKYIYVYYNQSEVPLGY